jgi:serine/threonine protein kinase
MNWLYQNKEILNILNFPEGTYGFIYEVTHTPTDKKYLGKKVLYFERNVKLGKKELILLQEERKEKGLRGRVPSKKKTITESDWKTYHGSQKEILQLVKEGNQSEFKREILQLVGDKKQLTYYECKYLFNKGVLESNNSYINDNILGKFFRKDFLDTKK